MEENYWQESWHKNKIGFHQSNINSRLKKFWPQLAVPPSSEVLVPLCGKSQDILWLREQGYRVVGVEFSEKAVKAFFAENNLTYTEQNAGNLQEFTGTELASGIRLLCGDMFDVGPADVDQVAGFYDRAALVALPPEIRTRYAEHLAKILPADTVGLLISMIYDPSKMKGPPFSVDDEAVMSLFAHNFQVSQISQSGGPDILGNLADRGLDDLEERVYALKRSA